MQLLVTLALPWCGGALSGSIGVDLLTGISRATRVPAASVFIYEATGCDSTVSNSIACRVASDINVCGAMNVTLLFDDLAIFNNDEPLGNDGITSVAKNLSRALTDNALSCGSAALRIFSESFSAAANGSAYLAFACGSAPISIAGSGAGIAATGKSFSSSRELSQGALSGIIIAVLILIAAFCIGAIKIRRQRSDLCRPDIDAKRETQTMFSAANPLFGHSARHSESPPAAGSELLPVSLPGAMDGAVFSVDNPLYSQSPTSLAASPVSAAGMISNHVRMGGELGRGESASLSPSQLNSRVPPAILSLQFADADANAYARAETNIESSPWGSPFGQLSPLKSSMLPISYAPFVSSPSNPFAVGVEEPVWVSSGTEVSTGSSIRQPPPPPILVTIPQQDRAHDNRDLSFYGIEIEYNDWGW